MTDPYAAFSTPVGPSSPAPQRQPQQRLAPRQPRPQVRFADDNDAMIRTVIGEAANQPLEGQVAVASVIRNRARQRNLSPAQVVLERNQFEPWGTAATASRLMSIPSTDPRYVQASQAVARALAGEDPTGGADHFYAPRAQAALGRPEPDWARGRQARVIGDHNFYNLGGSTEDFRQISAPMPAQAPVAAADDPYAGIAAPVADAAAAEPQAGSSRENPFVIRNVEPGSPDDYAQNAAASFLKKGMWVRKPNGELTQLRGDAYINENSQRDAATGGVLLDEDDIGEQSRALGMAAIEQIPFADEGVAAVAGAISGRGYSDTRDSYQALQAIDNQSNRDARIVGGLLGFGGSLLAPAAGAGWIGRGAGFADRAARTALVGTPFGAFRGAGEAEGGAYERLGGAITGGIGGFAGGAGGSVAIDGVRAAAPRVASGLAEAGATIGRGFGRRVDNVEITPQATEQAADYVQRLIDSSGSDIQAALGRAGGKPLTFAEAIGPRGVATAAALGRREGRTSLMAATQLSSRAFERQQRIVSDMSDITGLDPAGAADLVENVVQTGRAAARPLYEAAYASPVQPTPVIERILARPHAKVALRRAYVLMRNEDQNPEALGLFVMDARGGLPTGGGRSVIAERDADLVADLDALRNGTRTVGSGRGDSLLEFISKNGGVRDDGGDLASIGADRWNREGAWRSRVVREDGLSMEDMAQRARDAGYFDDVADAAADSTDNYQRLSSRDLTAAIDDELRGNARFARERGDTERGARADLRKARRDALEERLAREGVDISRVSNDEAVRILREAEDMDARNMAFLEGDGPDAPRVELVEGEIPSMQTLDYVKRGLDQVLASKRDKTTGRLDMSDPSVRPIVDSIEQLRGELTRLNPSYREALATSSDYLSAQSAFNRAEQLFRTGTSARSFQQAIERMGEGERRALTAGIVDKIYRDAERNAVRMQDLIAPVTQQKLSMLLGVPAADDLVRRIGVEIDMAAGGSRMAPGTNSITPDVLIANAELDSANPIIEGLIRGTESGIGGLTNQVGRAIAAPVAGFIRGAATPAPRAMRDEIGRLLLQSPDDTLREIMALREAREAAARAAPTRGQPRGASPAVSRVLSGARQ